MARFDLYANPDDEFREIAPYLLDVQSEHVGALPTRIVIPLRPLQRLAHSSKPSDLLPVFEIRSQKYFLDTPALGAVPRQRLSQFVGSLADRQETVFAALDRIFGAY